MWAIFCTCNAAIVPPGWQRFLRVGPVIMAQQVPAEARPAEEAEAPAEEDAPAGEAEAPAEEDAPAGEAEAPAEELVPACACCYYTASVQLDPAKDPSLRTCGWFWDRSRESWVWWHGQAPHAPFPYPHQGLEQQDPDQGLQAPAPELGECEVLDDDEMITESI